jgi:hypothetical protein
VKDLQTEVGDGNRQLPPTKPPHSNIATGENDDDRKKLTDEMKARMQQEDWETWYKYFEEYEDRYCTERGARKWIPPVTE